MVPANIQFWQDYTNLTPSTLFRQSLHGQFTGVQLFFLLENCKRSRVPDIELNNIPYFGAQGT